MDRHRESRPRFVPQPIAPAALLFALACAGSAGAGTPVFRGPSQQPAAVRVERVRPRRESLATLSFLKTNMDFIRVRLDGLREQPLARNDRALALDPRFLAYRSMMDAARIAADSLGAAASDREHRTLLASVSEFARLEAELDQMDRLLAGEHTRLAALQADFAGRQTTALAIVVSGYPRGAELSSLTVRFDDGSSRDVTISAAEREALAHGGVLELFHGRIEPREQVFELALAGSGLAAAQPGFVSLSPATDRLTFLKLDLSSLRPAAGAAEILASTWLHDDALTAGDEHTPQP